MKMCFTVEMKHVQLEKGKETYVMDTGALVGSHVKYEPKHKVHKTGERWLYSAARKFIICFCNFATLLSIIDASSLK